MDHAGLIKAVKDAMEKLFENCDVTPDEMKTSLEDIKAECDSMIESLDDEETSRSSGGWP